MPLPFDDNGSLKFLDSSLGGLQFLTLSNVASPSLMSNVASSFLMSNVASPSPITTDVTSHLPSPICTRI